MRATGNGLALVGVVSRSEHTEFRLFASFKAGRPIALSVRVYRRNARDRAIVWQEGNESVKVPLSALPDLIEMMDTAMRLTAADPAVASLHSHTRTNPTQ